MMIVYKTTNLINGKIYVGQDRYNNVLYLGSGLLLHKAIKKYGIENFSKEIIEECFSEKDLNEKEIFWIKTLNSINPSIGYNIAIGGAGGDTISHHPRKDEIGANLSKKLKERYKDKTKHPSFGKIQSVQSNEKRRNLILGIKRSKETKEKQSKAAEGENNSAYGKHWICNALLNKNKLVKAEEYMTYLNNGWKPGIIFRKNDG